MANIKNITKKLINTGFSESKLMMMTEKEIRKAYKIFKEESTMKNHANEVETINSETTVEKEETTMRTTDELLYDALTITKIQDKNYVTNVMLRNEYNRITGDVIGSKKTRPVIIKAIQDAIGEIKVICENRLDDAGNTNTTEKRFANAVEAEKYALEAAEYNSVISVRIIDGENVSIVKPEPVSVGDLDITRDNAPESIKEPVSVAENTAPVSDAKAKTIEVLKLIKDAAVANHNKGFGTTVSAYMLCAYILQAGYGIKKLKGHEAEITDEQKDTVKRVRQWLIDKEYIKACVYKTNGKSVYTDDYDGNYADSMVHHSKSLGLTCVGVSSYKVLF